jgi:16S rRNA processing protein RimM
VAELVEIGYVARAHGVRGELRVHLHNPESEALAGAELVYLNRARFAVEHVRPGGKGAVLLKLAGVGDRDAAEALRGAALGLPRDAVADADEVLIDELVGCAVELEDGSPWGTVTGYELGPQDRLVIRDGQRERQLPLVDAFVVDVDLARRTLVVAPPEGLPEDEVGD